MKFVLHLEDDGYQMRFWDEINETIGESIATNWDRKKLYEELFNKGFKINKDEFEKAIKILDDVQKPFVVLKSQKKEIDLDTFLSDLFIIDEELTDGK